MGETIRETVVRWHTASVGVGEIPHDHGHVPDGWVLHSEWEIVTAFWSVTDGRSVVVWKCRISREMEGPRVDDLSL